MLARLCESCRRRSAEFTVCRVSGTGQRAERRLCETCTRDSERILFGDRGLPLTDLLKALVIEPSVSEGRENRTKVCPSCGNTVDEITGAGMVGCAVCYMVFREEIDQVICQLHGRPPGQGKPA